MTHIWKCKWVAAATAFAVGLAWIGTMSVATAAGDDEFTYVGSNKCKKCHMKEYKSWAKTRMGQAFETLKPGAASEARAKAGLDSAKDYSSDESCLECHTTGLGKGGFAVQTDEKLAKKALKSFGNVGCECCHGPGSGYIKLHEELKKSKEKYKVEDMYAAGMTKIDETTCTTCHNDRSPTKAEFKYDPADRTGMHDLIELKQREE